MIIHVRHCFSDDLPPSVNKMFASLPLGNKQKHKMSMLPETRALLEDFYAPTNQALADMLHDERYLWRD